jgi:hypothetical protein
VVDGVGTAAAAGANVDRGPARCRCSGTTPPSANRHLARLAPSLWVCANLAGPGARMPACQQIAPTPSHVLRLADVCLGTTRMGHCCISSTAHIDQDHGMARLVLPAQLHGSAHCSVGIVGLNAQLVVPAHGLVGLARPGRGGHHALCCARLCRLVSMSPAVWVQALFIGMAVLFDEHGGWVRASWAGRGRLRLGVVLLGLVLVTVSLGVVDGAVRASCCGPRPRCGSRAGCSGRRCGSSAG